MGVFRDFCTAVRQRRTWASDGGAAIVDVLMAASLLATVSIATLTSLDVAQNVSAGQRSKAVAANVAENEIVRVRSLPKDALRGFTTATSTETVDGIEYTVTSTAAWNPPPNAPSCTVSGLSTSFRLTVTVAWGTAGESVTLRTIVAPGARGGTRTTAVLVVHVRDHLDNPAPGVNVRLSRPGSAYNLTTSADGCVVEDDFPSGQWRLEVDKPGWVTPSSLSGYIDLNLWVAPRSETIQRYQLAPGGRIAGNFIAERSFPSAGDGPTRPESYVYAHPSFPIGYRIEYTSNDTYETPLLYPHPSPYVVYAGRCQAAQPPSPQSALVPAGGTARMDVRLPGLDLSAPFSLFLLGPQRAGIGITTVCGDQLNGRFTDAATGRLSDTGVPYGPVQVCLRRWDGEIKRYNLTPAFSSTQPTLTFGLLGDQFWLKWLTPICY